MDPDEHLTSISHAAACSSVRALRQRLSGSFRDICPSVDMSNAGYCASGEAASAASGESGSATGGESLLDTRPSVLAPILFHTRPRPLAAPAVEQYDCSPAAAPGPRWQPAVARAENTTHAADVEPVELRGGGKPAADKRKKPRKGKVVHERLSSALRRKIEKERIRMANAEPPHVAGGGEVQHGGRHLSHNEALVSQSYAVRLEPCTMRLNFSFGPSVSAPEHGASSAGLAMFDHVDGAELCYGLFPHVRFPDGSLHHIYHENRLHEIVRGPLRGIATRIA